MPNTEGAGEPQPSASRRARDEAQLILGQAHGLVWVAVNDVDQWYETGATTEEGEPELTAEDIRRAGAEVHAHFGTVQAALNTGAYDEELLRVGFSGAQGEAKKKGFAAAIARFFARGKRIQN